MDCYQSCKWNNIKFLVSNDLKHRRYDFCQAFFSSLLSTLKMNSVYILSLFFQLP
jgi:hypothetical protein